MSKPGRYKKILLPLDGSGWAKRVIPDAVDIARSNDSQLILLHVYAPPARQYTDQLVLAGQGSQVDPARAQAEQYLIGLGAELRSEQLDVRTHIVEGVGVARLICDFVQDEEIDLIVMSTHGRSGLARLLFGSVAREVMECADVPVMLIQPDKE